MRSKACIASIEPGTVTAFVGPSGCGKSSLVKLVAGLIKPSAGRIHVNGTPVNAPRSDIGVAFQNPTMMPWRTVLGNILISAEVSSYHRDSVPRQPGAVSRPRSGIAQARGVARRRERAALGDVRRHAAARLAAAAR